MGDDSRHPGPAPLQGYRNEPRRQLHPRPHAPVQAAIDHAVLAGTLDPLVVIDASGIVQFASDSCERVLGWPPHDLVGQNVSLIMDEPHRSAHDGYLERYHRTGQTGILGRPREFEGVRRDGQRIPIEVSVSRIEPPGVGGPLFVGLIRDLTEHKRLERELRLIKDLAVCVCSAATLAEAARSTIERIAQTVGWDYAEAWMPAKSGSLERVAVWLDGGEGLASFEGAGNQPRPIAGGDIIAQGWDASGPLWFDDLEHLGACQRSAQAREVGLHGACMAPVRCDGDPVALLAFFVRSPGPRDDALLELIRAGLTPLGTLIRRRLAEEQLAESRKQLEVLVKERTRQLEHSHDQLRLAERLAGIGTLAAGLGHDMNNVLLPVRSHVNALRARAGGDHATLEHLEQIGASTAYLQQLADGLHYLAMDPQDDAAQPAETNLNRWWAEVGVLLTKGVPRHARVWTMLDPACPPVAIAAHRLTQAVLNLVVNAGEAHGCRRVRISSKAQGEMVRLRVADDGGGMDEVAQRRAFEMFFTTKRRAMGTGLGLALVHRIATDAGGSVGLRSRPGRGTIIEVHLPTAATATQGESPRVCLAIDHGQARSLLEQLFEQAGARLLGQLQGADILVAQATALEDPELRQWRQQRPERRLVALGVSDARELPQGVVAVADPRDFEALRIAVMAAMRHERPGKARQTQRDASSHRGEP